MLPFFEVPEHFSPAFSVVGIKDFELSLVHDKLYHVVAGHWNKFYASCLFLLLQDWCDLK